MPVLIDRDDLQEWLCPTSLSPSWDVWIDAKRQIQRWQATPVRRLVNLAINQGPGLIEPCEVEME
jgi:putative SOS response-associated peptidase YedK